MNKGHSETYPRIPRLPISITRFLALAALAAGASLLAIPMEPAFAQIQAPKASVVSATGPFLLPPVPLLQPIDEQVLALTFARDGKRLITAGAWDTRAGQIKIWDLETGKELAKVRGIRGTRTVALSPDGQTLACGEFGGAIKLRDPNTGRERAVLKGHSMGVNGLAFSPDGALLASAGLDMLVKLWDVKAKQELQVFHGHVDMVLATAFFRHGQAFVTGSKDKTAKIWDLRTGKEKVTLRHGDGIETVAISPDDKIVATGCWDRTIKLWNAETGRETAELKGNSSSVRAVAFSPDGSVLAVATVDGVVRLWDVKTCQAVGSPGKHASGAWALAFSPDGKFLASGSADTTAKVWDVAAMKKVATKAIPPKKGENWIKELVTLNTSELRPIRALACTPDGKVLGVATDDHQVRLHDAQTGAVLAVLRGHANVVTCLAFSPDGQTLGSGSTDHTVKLWNRAMGKETRTLRGPSTEVSALAFSPDGKTLASAGADKAIHLWDPNSGIPVGKFQGHEDAVLALVYAPDGRSLVSGSADGTIKVWSQEKAARTLKGHGGAVRALAFSIEDTLASADEEGTIKLWEPASGKEMLTLNGHAGAVLALAFAIDGRTLVSGGQDETMIVWDAVGGRQRQLLKGHTRAVRGLALNPQDGQLISGSEDSMLLRWRAATKAAHAADEFNHDFSPKGSEIANQNAEIAHQDAEPAHLPARTALWWLAALSGLVLVMGGVSMWWRKTRDDKEATPQPMPQPQPKAAVALSESAKGPKLQGNVVPRILIAVVGAVAGGGLAVLGVSFGMTEEKESLVVDFRGGVLPSTMDMFGLEAKQYVNVGGEGLRITLPPDRQNLGPVGVSMPVSLWGDFAVTTTFEILQADAPHSGYGVGVLLALNQKMRVGRLVRAEGKQVILWDHNAGRVNGKVKLEGKASECLARVGRLRLQRVGKNLRFQWAPGATGNDFQLIHESEEEEGIEQIKLIAQTGREPCKLDVRFQDLQVANLSGPDQTNWRLPAAAIGTVIGGLGGWYVGKSLARLRPAATVR